MGDTLWPANAVSGSPEYSARQARQALSVGLAGATTTRPLGARSGVRPGTATNTVTATSTTWTCKPFAGVADVMTAAESGPYTFAFDANATGSIVAADASLARKDIIYISVADPAESVGATPSVTRKYLAGVPDSSPVAPTVPGSERGFVVAVINVPQSGGGSPSVTWVAPIMSAAGAVILVRDQAEQDALTPYTGMEIRRLDTGRRYVRRSSAWSVVPVRFEGRIRRSDGNLSLNNGTTALQFSSVPANTLDAVTGTDGNGVFLQVPEAGTYRFTGELPVSVATQAWMYMSLNTGASGAVVLSSNQAEISAPAGFAKLTFDVTVYVPDAALSTKFWFPVNSNAAGTMRADGYVRVFRMDDLW